ncbi:hypothetical protein [Conexibacter arvalis]|uniref:hypothetical protein n=1 Tax=Conexibacter arvalis TaxID=912552 RepID=UPI00161622B9|nr:hypothetical protein [Conexibacter arvalis]
MAERVDRPLSLFDELEALAPATVLERERAIPREAEPVVPVEGTGLREGVVADGAVVREHGGVGGEPTLDEMIVGAWEGLAAQAAVACPLCDDGTLRPLYADAGGSSPPVAGRCDGCGTTLS